MLHANAKWILMITHLPRTKITMSFNHEVLVLITRCLAGLRTLDITLLPASRLLLHRLLR